MLAKRATLALLAVRALSALASPLDLFTVQDSDFYKFHTASDSIYTDAGSTKPPDSNPKVRLDDGLFVGHRKGQTDHFLGIPFALPP
jgi:hypothetical protein